MSRLGEALIARPGCEEQLLATELEYFELDAVHERLPGAVHLWMKGLVATPAASVVQSVDTTAGAVDPDAWIDRVEAAARRRGFAHSRIYLQDDVPHLERAMARRGYACRVEVGYLSTGTLPAPADDVRLRIASSDRDWEIRREIYRLSELGPDGHTGIPDEFVELERRKCDTGRMRAWLIEVAGDPCGAVCDMRAAGLVRLKNLVICPDYRRRGLSVAAALAVGKVAAAESRSVGAFALHGSCGERVYRRAGMRPALRQTEWYRPLPEKP